MLINQIAQRALKATDCVIVQTDDEATARAKLDSTALSVMGGASKADLDNFKTEVNAKISSVYTAAGSTAFSDLPDPSAAIAGNVYNISDEKGFDTDEHFVEGPGIHHPSGDNIVCVKVGTDYKWDVLAGFVDLSAYASATALQALQKEVTDLKAKLETNYLEKG